MGRLDGKVALVTAGGPNNGGTIAHMMAKEGARLICNDIVPSAAEETAEYLRLKGYEAIHTTADVSKEDEVKAMVTAGLDHYGYIDVLVNLAGSTYWHTVLDFDLQNFNHEIGTHLTGAALTMREVANALVSQGRTGSFINIASNAAHEGQPKRLSYSAAKAGLINLSRAAAMDLAGHGIRVNVMSPAGMEHNLWISRGMTTPRPRQQFMYTMQDSLDAMPLPRWVRSTDLGWLAIYLASDESAIVTGTDIPVDGGSGARYKPWTPGNDRELTVDQYVASEALFQRYGDTVAGPGVNLDDIPFSR